MFFVDKHVALRANKISASHTDSQRIAPISLGDTGSCLAVFSDRVSGEGWHRATGPLRYGVAPYFPFSGTVAGKYSRYYLPANHVACRLDG